MLIQKNAIFSGKVPLKSCPPNTNLLSTSITIVSAHQSLRNLYSLLFIIVVIEVYAGYVFFRSGTIFVEAVEDGNSKAEFFLERGIIGYNLTKEATQPTSAERCRVWVNDQIYLNVRRRSCIRSCPPTLSLARLLLGARWRRIYRTTKRGRSRYRNYCIYSTHWGRQDADECCYTYNGFSFGLYLYYDYVLGDYYYYPFFHFVRFFGDFFLASTPRRGSGHWHPYHPYVDRFNYNKEQVAYDDCCTNVDSTFDSCLLFYSVRPTCTSESWFFPYQWGKFTLFVNVWVTCG